MICASSSSTCASRAGDLRIEVVAGAGSNRASKRWTSSRAIGTFARSDGSMYSWLNGVPPCRKYLA